jgi:glutathione peroxidase
MTLYDFTVKDDLGEEVSLGRYVGEVLLIVNTASKCGFTPQFSGLEKLYETYREQGFTVLGFPCNQFANQDPGDMEEIKAFCSLNYGVTFPMMQKIDVNGEQTDPLYKFLKEQQHSLFGKSIKWNFTKFLVDRQGKVVGRFAPNVEPKKLEGKIKRLISHTL